MRGQPDFSSVDVPFAELTVNEVDLNEGLREQNAGPGLFRAADSSGTILVTADPMAKVVDVQISDKWSRRVNPEQFAVALFTTYLTAVQTAMIAHVSTVDRSAAVPRFEVIPVELPEEEWFRRVAAQLDETDDILAAVRRSAAEPRADTEIRGPNGYVTLVMRNGGPAAINADPRAIVRADVGRLRLDALDVFARAGLGKPPEPSEVIDEDDEFRIEY